MTRSRVFRDYPSQVRSFVLLLILCLVIMLVGVTYLYGTAKRHLARELDEQLQRAATRAMARLGLVAPRSDVGDLRSVLAETGVSRLFLWEAAGSETTFGAGPSARPPVKAVEDARAHGVRFTDFYGDRHQGYYRALLVPVSPGSGEAPRVLGVEARSDFLGFLNRIRWVIIIGYASGLAVALALGALFIRSVLGPYSRLTSVARDFRKAEGDSSKESPESIDLVVSTFQRAMEALREKEVELSRLYAAERTRAETLERYQQTILGSLSSGVISFKPDLTIAVFNKTAAGIFGIAGEEAVGRPCHEVFGADSEITAVAGEALREQRIFSRLELSVRRKDEAVRRVGLSSSLLKDSDGNLIGLALLLTDLTQIVQFREQAVMRESLAALGEMSAGIAHEFRNSLGVITGYAK
ncbi:MAG: PAS domain-containing protein, partial [Candidatus Methylomirabilaceae bacterium]